MSDDQDGCEWVSFLLVPAYPGSPGLTAVKRLCVCVVCVCTEWSTLDSNSCNESIPSLSFAASETSIPTCFTDTYTHTFHFTSIQITLLM